MKRGIIPIISEMDDSSAGLKDFLAKLAHDVSTVRP